MAEPSSTIDEFTIKDIISDALPGIEIVSFKTEPAVPAGEHYLSTLLRATVTFRPKGSDVDNETKLIIKTYPEGVLSGFIKESHMFIKELITYNKIIPKVNKICGFNITPVRLGSIREDALVLEDLKVKGFQMKNRVDKLDFGHAKAALILLAKLHSASITLNKSNPELFKEIKVEKIYEKNNTYMRSYVVNTLMVAGEEFEKLPHLKQYSDRLKKAGERIWHTMIKEMVPKEDEINVFNHGDFWTTNILYSYEKDNIKDVKFVDFQFCRWGSPAFDLHMLFTTSLRDRKDIPKLTSIYLEHLNNLQPNILTEECLENEMRRLDCFAFLTSICAMPICTLDPKTPLNFSDTTVDDFDNDFPKDRPNPYLTALKDKRFLDIIPEYLEFYEERRLL